MLTNPDLRFLESLPVRCKEELDSVKGSVKSQGLAAEDAQNNVRKDGREPQNLELEIVEALFLTMTHERCMI